MSNPAYTSQHFQTYVPHHKHAKPPKGFVHQFTKQDFRYGQVNFASQRKKGRADSKPKSTKIFFKTSKPSCLSATSETESKKQLFKKQFCLTDSF